MDDSCRERDRDRARRQAQQFSKVKERIRIMRFDCQADCGRAGRRREGATGIKKKQASSWAGRLAGEQAGGRDVDEGGRGMCVGPGDDRVVVDLVFLSLFFWVRRDERGRRGERGS